MPNRKQSQTKRTAKPSNFTNNRKITGKAVSGISARHKRVSGSELIASFPIPDGEEFFFEIQNEYRSYEDLRLAKLFEMYERWFVHSLTLEWVPSLPVTTPGTIHIAPEFDISDHISTTTKEATIVALSKNYAYTSAPITESIKCRMENFRLPSGRWAFDDLFTSPTSDERFTTFGKFQIVIDTPPNEVPQTAGRMLFHYDIDFAIPQLATPYEAVKFGEDGKITVAMSSQHGTYLPSLTSAQGTDFTMGSSSEPEIFASSDTVVRAKIGPTEGSDSYFNLRGSRLPEGTTVYARPSIWDTFQNLAISSSKYLGQLAVDRDFTNLVSIVTSPGPTSLTLEDSTILAGRILNGIP